MDAMRPARGDGEGRPGRNSGWWVVASVITVVAVSVVAVLVRPSPAAVIVGRC